MASKKRNHGHRKPKHDAEVNHTLEAIATRNAEMASGIDAWHHYLMQHGLQESEPLKLPLPVDARVSSDFGLREIDFGTKDHKGTDLVPADGASDARIIAAMSGTVLFSGTWNKQLGEGIIVGSDDGKYIMVYGHLKAGSFDHVKPGMHVRQGQEIADMGATGNASGRCLHFLVRQATTEFTAEKLADAIDSPRDFVLTDAQGYRLRGDGARKTMAQWEKFYDYVQPLLGSRMIQNNDIIPAGSVLGMQFPKIFKLPDLPIIDEIIDRLRNQFPASEKLSVGASAPETNTILTVSRADHLPPPPFITTPRMPHPKELAKK